MSFFSSANLILKSLLIKSLLFLHFVSHNHRMIFSLHLFFLLFKLPTLVQCPNIPCSSCDLCFSHRIMVKCQLTNMSPYQVRSQFQGCWIPRCHYPIFMNCAIFLRGRIIVSHNLLHNDFIGIPTPVNWILTLGVHSLLDYSNWVANHPPQSKTV